MVWILLALLALVAIGACTVAVRFFRTHAGAPSSSPGPRPRCLNCLGTGWVGGKPERTFNFTGEGFENRHTPKTQCPHCGGTGFTRR